MDGKTRFKRYLRSVFGGVLILNVLFTSISTIILAQWSNDPNVNTIVTLNAISPRVVSDGEGGIIIFYLTNYTPYNMYAQKVDNYGYVQWENPLDLGGYDDYQPGVNVYNDQINEYVLLLFDSHDVYDSSGHDYYRVSKLLAQKMDTSYSTLWGNGIRVSTDSTHQSRGVSVPDQSGGLYVGWSDSGYIKMQKISASGIRQWGENGFIIDDFSGYAFKLIPRLDDGVIITWYSNNVMHYAFVDSTGSIIWNVTPIYGSWHITSDGYNGVIVVRHALIEPNRLQFIVNRLSENGEILWGDGVVLADSLTSNTNIYSVITNDNVYFTWSQDIDQVKKTVVRPISLDGELLWDNFNICNNDSIYSYPRDIINSGTAIICSWIEEYYNDDYLVKAQKYDSLGNAIWENGPIEITSGFARYFKFTSDQNNGAIAVWQNGGIYAQQISSEGNLGEVLRTANSDYIYTSNNIHISTYPNPFNPETTIKYDLPERSQVLLTIFDLLGRKINTLKNQTEDAGYYSIKWDGMDENGQSISSGVYIINISAQSSGSNETFSKSQKVVLLK